MLHSLSAADLKSIMAGSAEADTRVMGVDSQIPAMSGIHHMGSDVVPLDTTMAFEASYVQGNQAEARGEQAKWIAEGHTGIWTRSAPASRFDLPISRELPDVGRLPRAANSCCAPRLFEWPYSLSRRESIPFFWRQKGSDPRHYPNAFPRYFW